MMLTQIESYSIARASASVITAYLKFVADFGRHIHWAGRFSQYRDRYLKAVLAVMECKYPLAKEKSTEKTLPALALLEGRFTHYYSLKCETYLDAQPE